MQTGSSLSLVQYLARAGRRLTIAVGLLAASMSLGMTAGVAHAAYTSTYYSTASPLPSAWAAGSPISSYSGFGMSGCSTGTWNRYNSLRSGSHVLHTANSSTGCPFLLLGHTDDAVYASCYAQSGGTYYANCQVRIP